jgi:hypothetical protein
VFSKQKRTGLENKNSFTAPGAAKPEMFRDSGAERAAANYDKIKGPHVYAGRKRVIVHVFRRGTKRRVRVC